MPSACPIVWNGIKRKHKGRCKKRSARGERDNDKEDDLKITKVAKSDRQQGLKAKRESCCQTVLL